MLRLLAKLFKKVEVKRASPADQERLAFEQMAKEQFLKLKEKGLSIPILSL